MQSYNKDAELHEKMLALDVQWNPHTNTHRSRQRCRTSIKKRLKSQSV